MKSLLFAAATAFARTVLGFRAHPRTVYVTEITYRDYYSNGTRRIWTRTI